MQVCNVVFRCGTSLDEVQGSALIYDDQRVLKLTCSRCIQTEIGLKRNLHTDALRNIHERTAGPNCAVQSCKFMISRSHELHEVSADHLCILLAVLSTHCALKIGINNTLSSHFLADIVVNQLGVVLCTHTSERFTLCLRDTQLLKCILDVLRHLRPLCTHMSVWTDIGNDVVHVQLIDRRTPVRDLHLIVCLQSFMTEYSHPLRIILLFGNFFHNITCQSGFYPISILFLISEIVEASVHVLYICFLFLSHDLSSYLRDAISM